jgi:hypothetical protein
MALVVMKINAVPVKAVELAKAAEEWAAVLVVKFRTRLQSPLFYSALDFVF